MNAITREPIIDRQRDAGPSPDPVQIDRALPMLQAYMPMMTAGALTTAGRIGLFERLADGPRDLPELAGRLEVDTEALRSLVDFLLASGFLLRSGAEISNTPETTRWFTTRGEIDYSCGLDWTVESWKLMNDLPAAVTRGGPELLLWDRMVAEPKLGLRFSRYMEAFAEHLSPDLLNAIGVPAGRRRLLDLGGSHGSHSIAFCRAYPSLSAVIVDLGTALTQTYARIEREGMSDRIAVQPGDVRDCDWGDGYDVALYLSVAHNMSLEENRKIFRQLGHAVRPGGVLLIHDYPRDTTPPLFDAAFRLTLLVETGTRTLTCAEFDGLLSEAGFSLDQLRVLSPAEKGTLIIARR